MKSIITALKQIPSMISNYLTDIVLIIGIISISIGSFLVSIVTGFYVTGAMLILLAIALFRFGGD